MPRDTPPTLISYTEIAYTGRSNTSQTSAAVSWQAGDVIVVMAGSEGVGGEQFGTPTATGLTFTQRQNRVAASAPAAGAWTAQPVSAGSAAITVPLANASNAMFGASIWVWRGSDGVGITWCPAGSTNLTTTQTPTDTHSAFCWAVYDWNAITPTGVGVPTPTHTDESALESNGVYSVYAFDLVDKASAAAQAFGISAYTGAGPLVHVGVEVLGTTAYVPSVTVTRRAGFPVQQADTLQTISVTPVAVGDLLVVGIDVTGGTSPVITGVSGGGTTNWQQAVDFFDTATFAESTVWWATAQTVGSPQTITATGTGLSGAFLRFGVDSYAATGAAGAAWRLDAAGSRSSSGTVVLFPTLISSSPGSELYWATCFENSSGDWVNGSTPGFTYETNPFLDGAIVHNATLAEGAAYSPTSGAIVAFSGATAAAAIFKFAAPEGAASAGLAGMFDPMLNPLGAF